MAHSFQNAAKWFAFVIRLLQLALSVLIIVLVRFSLHGRTGDTVDSCLLAPVQDWQEACTYADIVASISILFTFVTFLLQLYFTHQEINSRNNSGQGFGVLASRNICDRLAYALHIAVLALAASWWAAAAVVLTHYGVRAGHAPLPHGGARIAVIASCWVSLAVFLAVLAIEVWQQAAARAMQPVTMAASIPGNRPQGGHSGHHQYNSAFVLRPPPTRVHVGSVVYGIPANPLLQLSPALSTAAPGPGAPDAVRTQQQQHIREHTSTPWQQQDAGRAQHTPCKALTTVNSAPGLGVHIADTTNTAAAAAATAAGAGPPSRSVPLPAAASISSVGHAPHSPDGVQ